jgi:hypothetical protein
VGTNLRVKVITDWRRCHRTSFWPELLTSLDGDPPVEFEEYPLAECLSGTSPQDRITAECDVLIVNWDAVNGDPDFGADLAQRWFAHRRPEIMNWINKGGILIVEGQATSGVPDQRAYDAILGASELLLSRPEDHLNLEQETKRQGERCRLRPEATTSFVPGDPRLTVVTPRTYDDMFQTTAHNPAGNVLDPSFSRQRWNKLYRGWFRRRWGPSQLTWSALIDTDDRRSLRNHPTLMAARHGEGAIFASTMLLASSGQTELVRALLACHENLARIPDRARINLGRIAEKGMTASLTSVAGGLIVFAGSAGNYVAAGVVAIVVGLLMWLGARLLDRLNVWPWIREVLLGD